ncbi:MAG: hypothetical protein UW55_C0033G0002 [Candidatus Giovannonibacteria bacterium GW2011_GWA2_44_26]|uniref:Uncharacterized protein n=1 Tax=Candidatus Giovannonibacteria bacterium GW2011_GWA2_44_26 TaxID=1618648 RepID=A0A0G1IPL2_9BACT|nr:MAG: hypothetical protein UW55_C0033G0002 [Candidatus Giovannonibacteria bacterium GW2011_GWA2_44_26]
MEDLVIGCVSVLKNKDKALNQVINLSTSESISAIAMAKDIKNILKSNSNIINIEQRKNQTLHEKISVLKSKDLLGWEAKTPCF